MRKFSKLRLAVRPKPVRLTFPVLQRAPAQRTISCFAMRKDAVDKPGFHGNENLHGGMVPVLTNTKPMTPAIGAELELVKNIGDSRCHSVNEILSNVNDNPEIANALLDEIYAALVKHHLLVIRGQTDLSLNSHVKLAQSFGELEAEHPLYPRADGAGRITKLETGHDKPPDTDTWHTDVTFRPRPPVLSILHAIDVPEVGGDTLWSSQIAAYDALSAGMKQDLEGLVAVHDMGSFRNDFVSLARQKSGQESFGEEAAVLLKNGHEQFGSAVHRIVQEHPASGRKLLFVNPGFTCQIIGMASIESQKLLSFLFDHCVRPEFQVRLRWTPGTLVLWDNRSTMHYAVNDYMPAYRCMHRVTVVKDKRVEHEVQ